MSKVAIVTGGASGIGRAMARELATRGVRVTVADIDGDGASRVAKELGAAAVRLDVTDAQAVREVIAGLRERHGRLDFVFNNAGIGVGGRVDELTLDHWNRAIDINLRGVVHGVHAAYPIMVEQGHGHIVNTASMTGLTPVPLIAPYTTTKHAVVGLSLALRAEAAEHGVKVSVICPGFIDTPLLDNVNPGLPHTDISEHTRDVAIHVQRRLYPADHLARDVMRGLARDRAVIVAPATARVAWRLVRLAPGVAVRIMGFASSRIRRTATDHRTRSA